MNQKHRGEQEPFNGQLILLFRQGPTQRRRYGPRQVLRHGAAGDLSAHATGQAGSLHPHLKSNISLIFRIGNLSAGIQASFHKNPEGLAYLFPQILPRVGLPPFPFHTIPATCSNRHQRSGSLRIGISRRFASEWVARFRRNTRRDSLGICTKGVRPRLCPSRIKSIAAILKPT